MIARRITAATTAAATVTALIAAPGPVHASSLSPSQQTLNAAQTEQLLGPPDLPTIRVTGNPVRLTRSPRRGISDIHIIVDGVISGTIVVVIGAAGQLIKKWIFKGKGKHTKIYQNTGDDLCVASWQQDLWMVLSKCSDKQAIYWHPSANTGQWWNTHTGGVLTAYAPTDGDHMFTNYPKEDWHTWSYADVCGVCGCSGCFFGIMLALRNSKSHFLSDTTAASVP
jgi:hypothetical protein